MDELNIACDDCRSKFEITDENPPRAVKKQKKNVLDRHDGSYITLSNGKWKGQFQHDGKMKYTKNCGLAATAKLGATTLHLVMKSQVNNGNEIKWAPPLYGFTFPDFTELVRTQAKEIRDEKESIVKNFPQMFNSPEFNEEVDPVLASLKCVREDLTEPSKSWGFKQHHKSIAKVIIKNLEELEMHIETNGSEGCNEFIFADVGDGEDDETYNDTSFQGLQSEIETIEKDTFSMRAKCLALHLFLCEKGKSDTWNVPIRFMSNMNTIHLAQDRIERTARAAINHGAKSMWSQLVHDHRQEFVTPKYFGDINMDAIDSIDIEDKKVCLSLMSCLIHILTLHYSNSRISDAL